jgi:uncharacterized protein YdhG (YjbR/CyaY superfamily)
MKRATPESIDAYIARYPPDVQKKLQKIRATIRKAAPTATETISYGIPTFELNGHLVFYAGFKSHISIYPAPRGAPELEEELAAYAGGKGTLQVPLDTPVPYDLIRRITELRIRANAQAAEARTARKAAKAKKPAKAKEPTKSPKAKARKTKRP